MAYNNADIDRAITAIDQCLNSINYTFSKEFVEGDGVATTNWDANCNKKFTDLVNSLVTVRYKELNDKLNACKETLKSVSSIKKLEEDSAYYASQISSKSYELQEAKAFDERHKTNFNTYYSTEAKENRIKMEKLEGEINYLKAQKASIDNQISEYKNA